MPLKRSAHCLYRAAGLFFRSTKTRTNTLFAAIGRLRYIPIRRPVFVDVELPGATGITDQVKKNVQLYYDSEHESITILSSEDIDNVEIYQITGQKIKEVYGENTDRVSLSGLNKGIYLVKIIIGNKYIVEKIMKN